MEVAHPTRTIAQVYVPRTAINTIVLMVGFALLTAVAAQIRIPVLGSPVPVTGQTFAVLLSGAALGSRAGAGSQVIYWLLGAIGLPVFAQQSGGWEAATGATFGYLIGFVVAAYAVGRLAERGSDRTVRSAVPAFLLGNVIIYAIGVPWLLYSVPAIDTLSIAIAAGLTPFIIGDIIKMVLAGIALPAAWRAVEDSP